jgi:hypothetical protein
MTGFLQGEARFCQTGSLKPREVSEGNQSFALLNSFSSVNP